MHSSRNSIELAYHASQRSKGDWDCFWQFQCLHKRLMRLEQHLIYCERVWAACMSTQNTLFIELTIMGYGSRSEQRAIESIKPMPNACQAINCHSSRCRWNEVTFCTHSERSEHWLRYGVYCPRQKQCSQFSIFYGWCRCPMAYINDTDTHTYGSDGCADNASEFSGWFCWTNVERERMEKNRFSVDRRRLKSFNIVMLCSAHNLNPVNCIFARLEAMRGRERDIQRSFGMIEIVESFSTSFRFAPLSRHILFCLGFQHSLDCFCVAIKSHSDTPERERIYA